MTLIWLEFVKISHGDWSEWLALSKLLTCAWPDGFFPDFNPSATALHMSVRIMFFYGIA